MTTELNQGGEFEPIHAAHAIEQVAFVLQFDRPIDDTIFSNLLAEAEKFKEELPGKFLLQGMNIAIGNQAFTQQNISAGLMLQRAAPDTSIELELRIERSSLTFRTTRYTRWDTVWAQASKYFNAFLPLYLDQVRLLAVSLNYIDKFAWNGDPSNCVVSAMIRSESKYVCGHVFEAKDFWHSHTGLFIRVDDYTKRLLNVNLDYLDEPRPEGPKRIISITTVVTDQLSQPGYNEYLGTKEEALAMVNTRMNDMHTFGKAVLGDIMTPQMSKRIALTE